MLNYDTIHLYRAKHLLFSDSWKGEHYTTHTHTHTHTHHYYYKRSEFTGIVWVHVPLTVSHYVILCREESPKPTTALEYTYGRRSRGANIVSSLLAGFYQKKMGGGGGEEESMSIAGRECDYIVKINHALFNHANVLVQT